MRLLVVYQSAQRGWGKQIARFLCDNTPSGWQMHSHLMSHQLPAVVDHPDEYIPETLPDSDLLLMLAEDTGAAQLTALMAERGGVEAVLAPVDSHHWWPQGLRNQEKRSLNSMGVEVAFPLPFCALTEKHSENVYIKAFANYFGKPQVRVCQKDKTVSEIQVERATPCGNIYHVAEELIGYEVDDAGRKGGMLHHYYPCLAQRSFISKSAHITQTALESGLRGEKCAD